MYDFLRRIFLSNSLSKWFVSITIEKALITSSTFWIGKLLMSFEKARPIRNYLGLFVGSLLGSQLANIYCKMFLKDANADSLKAFHHEFQNNHRNQARNFNNQELKSEREPNITGGEGAKFISGSIEYMTKGITNMAGVTFGLITVALAANNKMVLASFMASPLLAFAVIKAAEKKLEQAYSVSQKARKHLSHISGMVWDNVTVSNEYNYQIYYKASEAALKAIKDTAANAERILRFSTFFAALLAYAPILFSVIYSIQGSKSNNRGGGRLSTKSLLIGSTLQQQISIFQSFYELCASISQWNIFISSAGLIYKSIAPLGQGDLATTPATISWDLLRFKGTQSSSYNQLEHLGSEIRVMDYGRITITGDNGSGKTTVLTHLKDQFGSQAFYLPTFSKLAFESTKGSKLSSGQEFKARLQEIIDNVKCKFIFLDEWDATLSISNREALDEVINKFAEDAVVVEVSHRQPSL